MSFTSLLESSVGQSLGRLPTLLPLPVFRGGCFWGPQVFTESIKRFEFGYGDADGNTDLGVNLEGYNRAFGGGILARYEAASGFYAEASGRVGGIKNSIDTDVTDVLGENRAGYADTSTYYGAHAGLGYVMKPVEKLTLDLSTKYFWTHQNDSHAVILNDPFSFATINSHRWRTGVRAGYDVTPCITPYAGASFEYEFAGQARGMAYDIALSRCISMARRI